jgi:hypothetical protein
MPRRAALVLSLLALLALTACGGGGAQDAAEPAAGEIDAAQGEVSEERGEVAFDDEQSATTETDGVAGAAAGDQATDGGGEAGAGDAAGEDLQLPDPPPAAPGDRIIKEGTVTVEVAQDGFTSAFDEVVALARRLGGSVLASTTRRTDDGATFGSVTLRVPVGAFEDLLTGVDGVGEVLAQNSTSQDVSTEFVDLQSRLRHLEAQERFYLGLLDKAQVVGDAIAVQQQLEGIQGQIEQIKGRIAFLDERTTFSTLTVELREPDVAPGLVESESASERPSLAGYWQTARDAFVNVVGALLVSLLFLLPLLLPLGAAVVAWRVLRRPPVRRADAPPPVARTDEQVGV